MQKTGLSLRSFYPTILSIPLYANSGTIWRRSFNPRGDIGTTAIALDRFATPDRILYHAFTLDHQLAPLNRTGLDATLLIVSFLNSD